MTKASKGNRRLAWLLAGMLALAVTGCGRPVPDAADRGAAAPTLPSPSEPADADGLDEAYQGIQDFGDPNAARLAALIDAMRSDQRTDKVLRIVQFGDSHTASDTFTSGVRARLQRELGDAGIGWVTPMGVRGQIHQRIKFDARHWQLTSSRTAASDHFPMGGFIAAPARAGAVLTIEPRGEDEASYRATFLLRQPPGQGAAATLALRDERSGAIHTLRPASRDGRWHEASATIHLPFTVLASSADGPELGGIWLERERASGVMLSPIGFNGARLESWQRWAPGWMAQLGRSRADLVILAYGTNEAFNEKLEAEAMQAELVDSIRQIRRTLPQAAILMIGAPESLVASSDEALGCAERRPAMHALVRQVQARVARQERVLFWDWSRAMGGGCAMLDWQARGWAGKDLVHFTLAGYQESARRFHEGFRAFFMPD